MRASIFTQGFVFFNGSTHLGEETAETSYRLLLKELTIWQGDAKIGGLYHFENCHRLTTGDGREWITVLPGKGYYSGPACLLDKIKGFSLNIRMVWDIDTNLSTKRMGSKEYKRLRKEAGLPNLGRPF